MIYKNLAMSSHSSPVISFNLLTLQPRPIWSMTSSSSESRNPTGFPFAIQGPLSIWSSSLITPRALSESSSSAFNLNLFASKFSLHCRSSSISLKMSCTLCSDFGCGVGSCWTSEFSTSVGCLGSANGLAVRFPFSYYDLESC